MDLILENRAYLFIYFSTHLYLYRFAYVHMVQHELFINIFVIKHCLFDI